MLQAYSVEVRRQDAQRAVAETRGFSLVLGARRADMEAGFNPVETLLAALGSCLLTGIQFVAESSKVPLEGARVVLEAHREDKPPRIVRIGFVMYLESPAPVERLERLYELTLKNSTLFQSLKVAIPITGRWERT
ncbi:OsmC family protein [Thermus caliditerrae]|uniref:OsmC family protein n=1 Tax=Thermus caliditerrae TaxID=1330700 RepID=UPI001F35A503|nr:OsmC family protein [Thermus caliditerrae]